MFYLVMVMKLVLQEQNKYSIECTDAMHCLFYLPLTIRCSNSRYTTA